jgi:lipopolysaccharide cholinephosphotransferase
MKFDMDYINLDEEIRCGYTVSKKQKAVWNVELDLLSKFIEVCKKYDIKYCAYCGTMLGAVRHKGFIPWDDDVDIAMTRENFEKFCAIADKVFMEPYFLQTGYNDSEFFLGYARLRNSNTTGLITYNISEDYNNGIYIDIFVLDAMTSDKRKLTQQVKSLNRIRWIVDTFNEKKIKKTRGFKFFIKKVLSLILNINGHDYWLNKYKKEISKYNETENVLSLMTHAENLRNVYWTKKEYLEDLIEMPFETLQVPVPKRYDEILTNFYGNYMEYPPMDERGEWHNGIIEFDPYTPYKEYIAKIKGYGY